MENALLVGLSRQMALSRELDVIANNIANIDTTGYKADNAAFSEYLMPGAQRRRVPRQRPARELRAGPRQLDRSEPRRPRAHRQSARRRHRRQRLSRGADAARTALHPQRRVRDQRYRAARHQRRRSGARQRRCDHVPARRSQRQHQPPTASSPCATAPARRMRRADNCKSPAFDKPQLLQKDGGSTFIAPNGVNAGPPPQGTHVVQGASRNRMYARSSRWRG